jgi:hypothetical protein
VNACDDAIDRLGLHRAAEEFEHAWERATLRDRFEGSLSNLLTSVLRPRSL